MSPATARAAAPSRTAAPSRRPEVDRRPDLRVLPPQPFRAPRGPFALLVGLVLTFGLLGVLLLNTVVAQDAFALSALEAKSAALADKEQLLTQQVAAVESPQRLESRARALGMVPSVNPLFLRLADGKVLGVPVAAKKPVAPKPKAAAAAAAPASTASTAATRTPTTGATAAPGSVTRDGASTPAAVRTKAAVARTRAAR